MNIFKVIANLGTILRFVNALKGYIAKAVAIKGIPNAIDAKSLMDAARLLLESGVIDIPGVDESQIANAIKDIEDQLCP